MNDNQDPMRQINYLQQCLSSDKRPLGLFLGAGCPVSVKIGEEKINPIIPDIAGITKAVLTNLSNDKKYSPLVEIVESHFKDDGKNDINIENILSHVRALRVVVGNAKVRNLSADDIDKLDARICEIIHELVDKELPSENTPYDSLALWINATTRERPIEIFTTNYDLLMEQAFEAHRVPYFDGFTGSRKPFFDTRAIEEDVLPSRWARLWKLHGSINWCQDPIKGVCRAIVKESLVKRVIHPSHLKYDESRRMPYLAMMDRLRNFLRQPSVALVICGYSFRDDHINEILMQGLQGTQGSIAFAMLYGSLDSYSRAIGLSKTCRKLTLLGGDAGVINGREIKWPEMEKDDALTEVGTGMKWIPVDIKDKAGKSRAEFTLGDFASFGDFLHESIGQISQASEWPNA